MDRPHGLSFIILVAACTLLSPLVPAAAGTPSLTPAFGSSRGGVGVPNGPVTCSELVTEATLTGLVSQYYPNASLLPSESQAEQAVNSAWNALCGSATFQGALSSAAGGWFAYIASMQDKNWTASGALVGSLFVDFELTWNASCPSGGAGYPAGHGCQFDDLWQANLTTQAVTGPAVTITSLRFAPCDTPHANETAVGSVEGFFPDPGTAPNESVAVQEVQTIWGEICTSSTYYQIAAPLPMPQALGFSTWRGSGGPNGTLGASGHLFFEWTLFTGNGPCPAHNGSATEGVTCSYSESWTADLTLDTYSGPTNSSFPNLGGAPLASSPTNSTDGWVTTATGFGLLGSVVAVAVLVGVLDRRRRG
jgi:hypothetical protein